MDVSERKPDLTACEPLDVWVLSPHEATPQGSAVIVTDSGVRLAFRPAEKEQCNERTQWYVQ